MNNNFGITVPEKVDNKQYKTTPGMDMFRDVAEEILGELDTATSFMYLFRRFGTPYQSNADDYKILYEYRFLYKDLHIHIHASYYEFVYWNVAVKNKYHDALIDSLKQGDILLYKKAIAKGIYPCHSWCRPFDIFTISNFNEMHGTIWEIYYKELKEFLPDKYSRLKYILENKNDVSSEDKKNNMRDEFLGATKEFSQYLQDKFRSSLNEEEEQIITKWMRLELSEDMPEIYSQWTEFLKEMKRGFKVRDCAINILGYESETNKITEYEINYSEDEV